MKSSTSVSLLLFVDTRIFLAIAASILLSSRGKEGDKIIHLVARILQFLCSVAGSHQALREREKERERERELERERGRETERDREKIDQAILVI